MSSFIGGCFFMTNPLMYTVQNTARSVLFAATIVLLGVVLMTPPAALAQTSSNAETKTEPKAKAKGEPKGNPKGAEKTAAPASDSSACGLSPILSARERLNTTNSGKRTGVGVVRL
jgi:hypothetical protein